MKRAEWLKMNINERAEIIQNNPRGDYDRFLRVVRRLHDRYYVPGEGIVMDVGGKPSRYVQLSDAAWMRYVIGIDKETPRERCIAGCKALEKEKAGIIDRTRICKINLRLMELRGLWHRNNWATAGV